METRPSLTIRRGLNRSCVDSASGRLITPVPRETIPPSLRALRLQRLETLGLSPDDPDLPETWRTDQWWREEGLWPDKPPNDGTR